MRNVHERRFPGADPADLGDRLDSLGQPHDRLWPNRSGRWAAMRLDGPLDTDPAGGHGVVRYRVVDHVPGESVTFEFDRGLGFDGIHRVDVLGPEPGPEAGATAPGLRHTIDARLVGVGPLLWPTLIRWMHDALIEEMFDDVEIDLGLRAEARPPGPWVRILLRVGPSPEEEERRVRRHA